MDNECFPREGSRKAIIVSSLSHTRYGIYHYGLKYRDHLVFMLILKRSLYFRPECTAVVYYCTLLWYPDILYVCAAINTIYERSMLKVLLHYAAQYAAQYAALIMVHYIGCQKRNNIIINSGLRLTYPPPPHYTAYIYMYTQASTTLIVFLHTSLLLQASFTLLVTLEYGGIHIHK